MALIDDVRTILNRLAPRGWKDLFAKHKLDITATNLQVELERLLPGISRDSKGFESFTIAGVRAIEPGVPARSLLYHALASADVHPTVNGNPNPDPAAYPTINDLDTIENYIYSRAKRTLRSFTNPVIVVVAYQYQHTLRSVHGKHADLSFSRTGIARLGTEGYRYEEQSRSFISLPRTGDRGFAVLPARYAAFIAEYRKPSSADTVLRRVALDRDFVFTFPAHKLFAGRECLFKPDGSPIDIQSLNFVEYHINEKLRRIHTNVPDNLGFVPPLPIFDINKPPFSRDSKNSTDLVAIEKRGSSILLVPQPHPLARTASQQVNGKNELARFVVPPARTFGPPESASSNRFATSLGFPTDDPANPSSRTAPSFANIRYEVLSSNNQQTVRNLATLPDAEYNKKLVEGNYEAAHFIDDNSEGAIGVEVKGLSLPVLNAYSIVSSIDLFPKVDQIEIQKWLERITRKPLGFALPDVHFSAGGPKPLSDDRFTTGSRTLLPTQRIPNPTLPNPTQPASSDQKAFTRSEAANLTATAIVGNAPFGIAFDLFKEGNASFPISWLPDAASGVFEPGWDTAVHSDSTGPFYASYGLGSPFQEDGKICAALNSFWPAATPDTARTFGSTFSPTAFPMVDSELGYHPQHPRVTAGEVKSRQGWDGLFGPFFESVNGKNFCNVADFNRADYVTSSIQNLFGFSGLDLNNATEMIARMDALRFCVRVLPPGNDAVPNTRLLLVVAEKVRDWKSWNSKTYPKANNILIDAGYIYIFVEVVNPNSTDPNPSNGGIPINDPPIRRRYEIAQRYECQIDYCNLFFRVGNGAFQQRSYNPTLPELPVLSLGNPALV